MTAPDRWPPGTRIRTPKGAAAIYLGDGWAWVPGYGEASDDPARPPRCAARVSDRWTLDLLPESLSPPGTLRRAVEDRLRELDDRWLPPEHRVPAGSVAAEVRRRVRAELMRLLEVAS